MIDILATVGLIIGCILVDVWIIILIWLLLDYYEDTDAETFFVIGFEVNTMLLFALLTAIIANKMIQ